MSFSAGEKLGPYELIALIGAGGMGQVYRARDPRLGRDVAVKVSSERFTERFQREARAVAALNHPNTCHLYDVGPNYLVMELVEGPTLADRSLRGTIGEILARWALGRLSRQCFRGFPGVRQAVFTRCRLFGWILRPLMDGLHN